MDGLAKLAADVKGVRMIAAFGDETQALLMYDLSTGPFGVLTCAKHLIVKDGKITRDQITFDSFQIRLKVTRPIDGSARPRPAAFQHQHRFVRPCSHSLERSIRRWRREDVVE